MPMTIRRNGKRLYSRSLKKYLIKIQVFLNQTSGGMSEYDCWVFSNVQMSYSSSTKAIYSTGLDLRSYTSIYVGVSYTRYYTNKSSYNGEGIGSSVSVDSSGVVTVSIGSNSQYLSKYMPSPNILICAK